MTETKAILHDLESDLGDQFPKSFWYSLAECRELLVDISDYTAAMVSQPRVAVILSDLHTMVNRALSRMETELAFFSATVEKDVREEAATAGSKMTNDAVKAAVTVHPSVRSLTDKVSSLTALKALVQGYIYAGRDRGEMARELSTNERAYLKSSH